MSNLSLSEYQDISAEDLKALMDEIAAREPQLDLDEIALDLEEVGRWLAREQLLRS